MKAILTLGRTTLEFEGTNFKELIKQMAFAQELPDMCPLCSAGVMLTYRSPSGNDYYGMRCFGEIPHEVNFHQHKEGGGLYYIGDEWKVAYGYDAESGERKGGQQETRREPERQSAAPAQAAASSTEDPFARRAAPASGAALGTAGPITQATLDKLVEKHKAHPGADFNEIANKLYQRNVVDLTEGQGIAMLQYLDML